MNIYVYWYWIYSGKIYSSNNWGYILILGKKLPTIGRYILVLDIFCNNWRIYSVNNWDIYVNYGVFVRPSGAGLQILHLQECVSFLKSMFCNPTPCNWHISPNCWQNMSNTNIWIQLTYIPQLLAEYIQYLFINSTYIYSSIVGRIYPILTYRFNVHIFPNC